MEVLGVDITSSQRKVVDEEINLFPTTEGKVKPKPVQGHGELIELGFVDTKDGTKGERKEVEDVANPNTLKNAVDEWPVAKQIRSFYFVKLRLYEDPKLKAKIEQAEKEIQKKNQARYQITEALKAKRSERAGIISLLKPLTAEKRQYSEAMNEKMKEMEPLQNALGKLRNENNAVREKGMGLCSSEEELNNRIKSIHYHISHESISLDEEKRLLKEIKQLEGTRAKVIANAAMRTRIQDSIGQKEAIQDQVKLIGADINEVKKEREAIRAQIKELEEQLKAIDGEISSLREQLASMNDKKDKAFGTINELKRAREDANACYYQNRSLLNNAKVLAARKDVATLKDSPTVRCVEKFMCQWSNSKAFREDYEKRILPSLDSRQLCRDGRMRNPNEKPIILEVQQATVPDTTPAKKTINQAKKDPQPIPTRVDTAFNEKVVDKVTTSKLVEAPAKIKTTSPEVNVDSHDNEKSRKEPLKASEMDAEKLRELKREEEIAKAKLAEERKKKLAEKSAAKAAARAQKEADKKFKEKEKRARKKAAASVPATHDDQIEVEMKVEGVLEAEAKAAVPSPVEAKGQQENTRHRNSQKKQKKLPKVVPKRQRSQSYWSWATPATIVASLLTLMLVAVLGYYYFSA
ncbi:proton pump-interactor 1-like [Ananas comosus]|uniref:Proton pump-interactor 1-like n=1 Tax=Ananas comosus TaxID=4615 RepID=A0A6P5GSJ4_ANACO|nr:proton pump-interactor 1-like [Ananas comosus]